MMHHFLICLLFVIFSLLSVPQTRAVSIDELSRAIATAPVERLPSYYVYRSRAYLALGDEEHALADMETSLLVKPNTEAYLARGEYFQKTNRLDAAIKDYSAALTLNNDCVKAYQLRSSAYYAKKEYVQAIIDASHVQLYDEDDPFALNMIEKCYVQTSPKERIVMRSDVAAVMRIRKELLKSGGGKRYLPVPATRRTKVAATRKKKKKKCGPRRRS